jgi:hypothetical protein
MPIDAFRYQPGITSAQEFARGFLASPDFTTVELKAVCKALAITTAGKRNEIIDNIVNYMNISNAHTIQAANEIICQLVGRRKIWFTFELASGFVIPSEPYRSSAIELVLSEGEEKWYGPLSNPRDPDALWYIYPKFTDDWDVPEGHTEVQQFKVRWLCFGRVSNQSVSIHWRGFSHLEHSDEHVNTKRRTQFMYWLHVPELLTSLARQVQAETLRCTPLSRQ